MKNCPKCSSSVDDLAKFCPKCGASTSSKDPAIGGGKSKLPPAPPPVRKRTVPAVEKEIDIEQKVVIKNLPVSPQMSTSTKFFWIIIF
ncbi:MAG: zinc-ribbon domain, partial [Pseudomonadota bacterium]